MKNDERDGAALPDGFTSQWASTVGGEDGFALQLLSDEDVEVLEVYRDDLRQGALSLRAPGPLSVPLVAVRWLLETAEREMPPFIADEDRDRPTTSAP